MLIRLKFVRPGSCSRPSKPLPRTREQTDSAAGRSPAEDTTARRSQNFSTAPRRRREHLLPRLAATARRVVSDTGASRIGLRCAARRRAGSRRCARRRFVPARTCSARAHRPRPFADDGGEADRHAVALAVGRHRHDDALIAEDGLGDPRARDADAELARVVAVDDLDVREADLALDLLAAPWTRSGRSLSLRSRASERPISPRQELSDWPRKRARRRSTPTLSRWTMSRSGEQQAARCCSVAKPDSPNDDPRSHLPPGERSRGLVKPGGKPRDARLQAVIAG
jgi:hypothetical protein